MLLVHLKLYVSLLPRGPLLLCYKIAYSYLFIIIGFQARISAGLLAIFCIVTAFVFHYDFANQMQTISFLKNVGLAGGFLFIVANGTKEWSVDREKKYVRL